MNMKRFALLLVTFRILAFASAQNANYDFVPTDAVKPQIALYKMSTVANLTKSDWLPNNTIPYNKISSLKQLPQNVKSLLVYLNIKNTSETDSIFYVYIKDEFVPEVYFYEITDTALCVGGTGFAHLQQTLSVPNSNNHIGFRLAPYNECRFILQFRDFEGSIFLPDFEILKETFFLKSTSPLNGTTGNPYNKLTLFFIGLHVCLTITGMFLLKNKRFRNPLKIFTAINFMYIFYYLNIYGFINMENRVLPGVRNIVYQQFWGCLEPAMYYLLFYSYLTFSKKYKYWGIFLKYSVLYWLIYFVLRIGDHTDPYLLYATQVMRKFATVYDFLITLLVFLYLLRFKSPFYKYARLGVAILLISAIQMSLPYIIGFLGIHKTPVVIGELSYAIMQFAIIADFLLFLYGVIIDTLEGEKEKQKLEKKLLETELAQQKLLLSERERISRDMHDNIGAGISALKLQAEFLKQKLDNNPSVSKDIEELLNTSEDMNFSMRELMWGLQSHEEHLGTFVSKALQQAKNFLSKSQVHFEHTEYIENNTAVISGPVRRELLFSLREAINNIYKHSGAANVFVSVLQTGSSLVVEVKDDGIGLNTMRQTGNGLHNMEQRMKNIGGVFEVLPTSGGTHLRYTVPL